MTLDESFADELRREAETTRRVLERVSEEQLAWKPHPKSMSLGELALHIAVLPTGIAQLITETEVEVPTFTRDQPKSRAEILATLEQSVAFATGKLAAWGEEGLAAMWRMKRDGQTILEMPRAAMFRSVMLNHWYHHRGQLTVYLRLLEVPLPDVYGPSADESPF